VFPESGVPARLLLGEGRGQVLAHPALVDAGDRVDVVLCASAAEQARLSPAGYVRLVLLADRGLARNMRRAVKENRRLGLLYAPLGSADALAEHVLHAATWSCFFEGEELPETQEAFRRRLAARRDRWQPSFVRVLRATESILEHRFAVARALDEARSPAFAAAVADIREHLARLVGADFLRRVPSARLEDLPRYLDGMRVRLEGLQGRVEKDAQAMRQVEVLRARIEAAAAAGASDACVESLAYALEELRIALFAQRLGTREKMSWKRFEELLVPVENALGLR
jgi:ATP-dependent helicase HrpA